MATTGTANYFEENDLDIVRVNKVSEGRPDIQDSIRNRQVQMVINTTSGAKAISHSKSLRLATLTNKIPYFTTMAGAASAADAIEALNAGNLEVRPLQDYFS
jgi:carbamoyl-phosphate synthase large subunit